MEIELVPSPAADDPAARAATAALEKEGLAGEVVPGGSSAWRRAGMRDALENRAAPGKTLAAEAATQVDYVSRARSSRGATRA